MSRKPSFANLRTRPARAPEPAMPEPARAAPAGEASAAGDRAGEGTPPAPGAPPATAPAGTRAISREGRKQVAGFFPPAMSLALNMLALRQDRSLQSLMAEAFNDVLRKHGESPVGE